MKNRINQILENKSEINSVIVFYKDKNILEKYKNGNDSDSLQSIASATKSVKTVLLSHAIKNSIISSIHDSIRLYLPTLPECFQSTSIESLLTMSSGINWPGPSRESISDSDVIQYIKKNKIEISNEKTFAYKPDSALILKLIETVYNQKIENIYQDVFKDLNIGTIDWKNNFSSYSGLRIRTMDLISIGNAILYSIKHQINELFNTKFLSEAFTPKTEGGFPENCLYGYLWWILKGTNIKGCFAAGFGGQYWFISTELQVIICITSNTYRPRLENKQILFEILDIIEEDYYGV